MQLYFPSKIMKTKENSKFQKILKIIINVTILYMSKDLKCPDTKKFQLQMLIKRERDRE